MSENEAFAKYDDSRQKNEEMPFLKQLFLHSNVQVRKLWISIKVPLHSGAGEEIS